MPFPHPDDDAPPITASDRKTNFIPIGQPREGTGRRIVIGGGNDPGSLFGACARIIGEAREWTDRFGLGWISAKPKRAFA